MVSLHRIAKIVDGEVHGDGSFEVNSLMSFDRAGSNALTFCVDAKKNHSGHTEAGAILVSPRNAEFFSVNRIVVEDPYLAYARVSGLFKRSGLSAVIASSARVPDTVRIGDRVSIGEYSVLGSGCNIGDDVVIGSGVQIGSDVSVGDGCIVEQNTVILDRSQLGKRCFLSPGVVIGSSGFGYAPAGESWQRIEQLGRVLIGDDVDIGANTTIDRGALDDTVIENGVKLDNLIQVAHNVQVGEHTAIAGCSAIAGSTVIGKRCKIGGRAAILGHLSITDDVTLLVNSLVTSNILEPGEYASMVPVQPAGQWRKNLAILRRLEQIRKKPRSQGEDG